jgi:type I restriction-modification system DNA methylase subunit
MAGRTTEFQAIRSEGGLLPADLLRRVLDPNSGLAGTRPEDYGLPQNERLNEVITQSWNRLGRHWAEFRTATGELPVGEGGTGLTNDKWSLPLLRELGFGLLPTSAGPEVGGRAYAISRFFGPVAVHLVGCGLSLDRRAAGQRGAAAANPHGLVQEFLNRSPGHLWGMVSNGLRLRMLRDNQALSRQSFLEFDLEAMFHGQVYSDFVLLWLMAHATRFAPREGERPATCWLEQWTKEAEEQGTRALKGLRGGVERALEILGEGFTSHPKNTALRDALRAGAIPLTDFHGQLLRVVYRLIFLFVAEDRTLDGQSLLHPPDDSDQARIARERYAAHYGTARLRELAGKIKGSRHGDLWRQFQLPLAALSGSDASIAVRQHLALPALGSFLWNPTSTAALNDTELTNYDFLEALRHLAFTRQGKLLRPVDYKNLGAEELGGVYESLLALTPQISADGARFTFAEFAGNERKISGSYYTQDSLVQCLLESALDPVAEEAIKGKVGTEAEKAILGLKVCDPAVGSGHFLVGAAHRLARHLSRVRALAEGESEPSPLLYQQALRDVIGRCLYGVDVNPMAAELCRVSLWLEALEPGKPLSFLDHHIRVGNSLLGATSELIAGGLPDEAFNAIEGDDKKACTALKKRNRAERKGLGPLFAEQDAELQMRLQLAAAALQELPDNRPEEIRAKELAFRSHEQTEEYRRKKLLADTWCAAFVIKKPFRAMQSQVSAIGITQGLLNDLADGRALPPDLAAEVNRLATQYQFFHWHLAFPEAFANGGFDCVLGNPPWVRQELLKPIKQLLPKFRAFSSTADSSVYFLELAMLVSRPLGRVAMLTPNKWFRASYAENLRRILRDRCRMNLLIDFGHSRDLFPDADTFPAIVVLQPVGVRVQDTEIAVFVRAHDSDRERESLSELIRSHAVAVPHSSLRDDRWNLEGSGENDLLDRLVTTGRPLEVVLRRPILRGLLTGFNDAFYIDTSAKDAMLASHPASESLFKKFLRGRDVKRWVPRWDGQWHIVIPSSQNRTWPWSSAANEFAAEEIFARAHPSVHDHLKRFEGRLRARQDKGEYWWELRACDYYEEFEKPKILVQCIAYYSQFAFDDVGHYVNNKAIVIPTDDLYVLAVLNSRITWWIVNRTFQHMKDEGLSVDVQFLKSLPIPIASNELHVDISKCASELIAAAASGSGDAAIQSLEVRLNGFVERAFALTDSERSILMASLPPRDPIQVFDGDSSQE